MAKSEDNLFTYGLRGMVGRQMVFRNRKGQITVSKRPRPPKTRSKDQRKHASRFKEAAIYAKAVLADEEIRKIYTERAAQDQEKIINAYNLAIGDYMKAPVIEKVNPDEYTGQAGERIIVSATDDFEVKEVTVEIRQSGGTFVEKGKALPDANGTDWKYTTQLVNTLFTGSIITVSASDRPGNITRKEVVKGER